MKPKNKPTLIYSGSDLKKFVICGCGNEIYVSNQMPSELVFNFLNICSNNIKIIIFDSREYDENGTVFRKNGTTEFRFNKKYKIYKQDYYHYSKNRKKYFL